MTKYNKLSIEELHQALVNKEVTPLELVEDCIEGVKNDDCNCFEATCFDEARKEAASITSVGEDEYLKGIPYLAKDNYSTKGIETTASSNILNGYIPLYDATVISKLKRAGMILVAKTTMDELAMGGSGTSGHKGPTLNPYDKTRIAGGSSCGSAAALASGIASFALGTDTGDSVRKPASYTNLVGFKPTWGRVSRYGVFPFAPSMDTVAYFTRNVLDSAYILSCLAGKDLKDMSTSSRKKEKYQNYVLENKTLKKIGYFKEVDEAIIDPVLKESYHSLLKKLKKEGYEVIAYDFDKAYLEALYPTYMLISSAEATSNNANLDGIRFGPGATDPKTYIEYMKECRTKGFSDMIKRRFVIGSFSLLSDNQDEMFSRAQKARRLIVDKMNKFFDDIDYLVLPASYNKPPKIEKLSKFWSPDPNFLDNILTIGNLGGFPSITLPLMGEEGLPFGINITGRVFEDGYVLALASQIEKLTGLKDLTKEN